MLDIRVGDIVGYKRSLSLWPGADKVVALVTEIQDDRAFVELLSEPQDDGQRNFYREDGMRLERLRIIARGQTKNV